MSISVRRCYQWGNKTKIVCTLIWIVIIWICYFFFVFFFRRHIRQFNSSLNWTSIKIRWVRSASHFFLAWCSEADIFLWLLLLMSLGKKSQKWDFSSDFFLLCVLVNKFNVILKRLVLYCAFFLDQEVHYHFIYF